MLMRRLAGPIALGVLLILGAGVANAQGTDAAANTGFHPTGLLDQVISTLVFSVLGIILAIVGFKLFDAVIPFSLEKEICEKNNLAVAILSAAMILGVCLIIAAVVMT